MRIIKGGITAPEGFVASGIHCGIKSWKKDLALIYSKRPAVACGVFTQNRIKAAPLKITAAHLRNHQAQAVIINSGNANCCTGRPGLADAQAMCAGVAGKLGLKPQAVLVASTGIIGRRLPFKKIEKKFSLLVDSLSSGGALAAAEAIMTTDTRPKQIAVQLKLGRSLLRIGAIAKGAGMIHPHLATMLAFITTDAAVTHQQLNIALRQAVGQSFNLITVDGDTSTNDMVLVLANGLAKNQALSFGELQLFQKALNFVCLSLAKMIVQDAEGATKFTEIRVQGAENLKQAKQVAFGVANSPLVKTALFGQKPNWGRIAAAVGMASPRIREERLSIQLGHTRVLRRGIPVKVNRHSLKQEFKQKEIFIKIDLGLGTVSAGVFTCDLSDKYVEINAKY